MQYTYKLDEKGIPYRIGVGEILVSRPFSAPLAHQGQLRGFNLYLYA